MKKIILAALLACLIQSFANAQSTSPAPYCDASFDDQQGFPVDDHINQVQFETLNNTTNAQFAAPHYVFYSNLPAPTVMAGVAYKLRLNFTVAGGNGFGVWIDYNHNNSFEANEKVAGTTGFNFLPMGASIADSATVTIPTTAMSGPTRMRVRIVEDDIHHGVSTDELPCNASNSATDVMDWGETEDYTITITSANAIADPTATPSIKLLQPMVENTIALTVPAVLDGTPYKVINALGAVQLSGSLKGGNQLLDCSNLPGGVYFIQMATPSNNQSLRVVKLSGSN